MTRNDLAGHSVLVAEDEVLLALDIVSALEDAGARAQIATRVAEALKLLERSPFTAAVLDHTLADGESSPLCARLTERSLPFVLYTGWNVVEGPCSLAPVVHKPASATELVAALGDEIG